MDDSRKYSSLRINQFKIHKQYGDILIDIEPGTFCTFDENIPSNGKHMHNCFELCVVTGGRGEFIHGDEKFPLSKGDIFITNPRIIHEIKILNNINPSCINILQLFYFSVNICRNNNNTGKIYEENLLSDFLENHCLIRNSQDQIISYLNFIYEYSDCKSSDDFGIRQAILNIVMNSLLILSGNSKDKQDNDYLFNNIVDQAIEYIGRNIGNKITLDEIAVYCRTSKRNLQYLFKKHMHSTIVDYINTRRMSLAGSYLRMNYRISDIGSKVGISDPTQFYRVFKKYYGISPKKYQILYSTNGMTYGADYK